MDFEKSISELEQIVSTLEKGELSLDEMLKLFEQGISLSRNCSKILDDAEAKVNILTKQNNEIVKKEFTASEE